MKNKLLQFAKVMLAIFAIILLFNSCDSTNGGADVRSYTFTVNSWNFDEGSETFFFDFNTSAITPFVMEQGDVSAYVLINGTYFPLEYSVFYILDNGMKLEEVLSYQYRTGVIGFNVKADDLHRIDPNYVPTKYTFKVVVTTPN